MPSDVSSLNSNEQSQTSSPAAASAAAAVMWPPMQLCHLRTRLTKKLYDNEQERQALMEKCSSLILSNNMAQLYESLCDDLGIESDEKTLLEMKSKNEHEISKLNDIIEKAQSSESEVDIKKMLMSKGDLLMKIGCKDEAIEVYEKVILDKPTTDTKIACLFKICYIYFFHGEFQSLKQALSRLEENLATHSSWEEKNRFKVYKGLYHLTQANFEESSKLLIDTIPTFNTTELITYEDLICYAVSLAMLTLPRRDLKSKCIDGQDVQEGLYGAPLVKNYLKSLYNCSYCEFLQNLVLIETEMKTSYFMHNVYQIYIDEIRAVAYSQLLESYSSLSLDYMSDLFGVIPEFMDEEISYYISRDKLNCKINKVTRTINTIESNLKSSQYKEILREGDYLLSQLQKLARKVNA